MNSLKYTMTLLLAAGSLSAIAQKKDNTLYPEGIQHVVVIGVDGLSPDGIRQAATPVLHKMITEGSVKWNVRTVLPSSSSSNWASMIMGAGVEQHGITDNDWERDAHSLPAIVRNEEGIFPTIFGVLRNNYPQAEIGAVYHWGGFGRLFEKHAVSYDKTFSTEDSTTQAFTAYLQKKPLFAFLHLDHVDGAGHEHGHGSTAYYQAVSKADSLIGEVLTGIKKAGIAQQTLVIVTADHGGVGYGHGGATPEETEIAMILYGKGIRKGYLIPEQVATYDLAATIAFALKTVPPYVWIGRPLRSAFEGFAAPSNLWLGKSLLSAPVIEPKKYLYQQAGGLYINTTAQVSISTTAQDAVTRYTLDGSQPDHTSPRYTQAFTLKKSTVVRAASFDKKDNESSPAVAYYRLVDSTQGNGLRVQLYTGQGWKYLPLFKDLTPVKEWQAYEFALNREQLLSMPDRQNGVFGIVFTGYLQIDTSGEYTFYNSSDDGSKLFVDEKEVVNNDGNHGVTERSGSILLSAGRHPIRVEFYNGEGGFWLDAFYKGPGLYKQLIPADKLFLNRQ
ncbi:alkaline phosphatase family protein [Chitinophaga pinensis]|uniref:Type I phosphodiesterase/nucleotide pyrophosphatase n=1 Tax=Chitinophaga pinensis (strain ATCC 43595 / DSM 2588 / LMG 13176 / NBRC 15968 / NCIMB 11800 / UQM 2034) TaxID=485918 RepID=A0A979G3W4_CHIPD|nr:alkaline phosphatase family protein [Chitinophaga pinensis]ACU60447.1 type I phosphodiesterase/nucleotide pyrophosphatase [Chitinophaga pinensis DSM 2588]